MNQLLTVADVIDALGGNEIAAETLDVAYNTICNWRMYNRFPTDTYLMIRDELKDRGLVAPDHLWPMRLSAAGARIEKNRKHQSRTTK
jgi:hypothetical protein